MRRRKFLLTSGTALLGSTAVQSVTQEPSVAINFDLAGVENIQPSNSDTILVGFENFELVPRYINSGDAKITITLDIEGYEPKQTQSTVTLTNGDTVNRSDLGSAVPIVQDSINSSESSLNGSVNIEISHPSVYDSYQQEFTITDDELQDGLVGYWPLHEWGGRANDLSGNDNHGTVTGATQGVWGRGGLTSYSFNGSNEDDVATGQNNLDMDKIGFTMSAWWKCGSDSNTQRVICKRDTNGAGYELVPRNDVISVFIGDQSDLQHLDVGSTVVTDNKWHHITALIEKPSNGSRKCQVYLDGEFDGSVNFSITGSISSTTDLHIGSSRNSVGFYTGNISEVRIYDRVLSEQEVQDLYNLGYGNYTVNSLSNGDDTGAVSRWSFNSGEVKTDKWSNRNLTDYTSAGTISRAIQGDAKDFDDSTSDYMTASGVSQDTDEITVSAWVKFDSLGTDTMSIVNERTSNNVGGYVLQVGSGKIVDWHVYNNGSYIDVDDKSISQTDVWYHFVGTYDGTTSKLYKNGSLISKNTNSGGINGVSEPIQIGGFETNNSEYLDGKLDDVRIYSRALNQQEVYELYNWGARGKDLRERTTTKNSNSIVSWWKLNETGGDIAYDEIGSTNGTIINGGDSNLKGANGIVHDNSYQFDGSNDLIKGISDVRSAFDSGPVALSMWAYKPSTSTGSQYIFDMDVQRWNINYNDWAPDTWSFDFYDGSERVLSGPNIEDEWIHFVAQQKSNNDIEFYMNSELVGSESASPIDPNSPSGPVIGSNTRENKNFQGRIDSVRIYNRALTPQEISYLYEQKY